jgi:hypothetical protein
LRERSFSDFILYITSHSIGTCFVLTSLLFLEAKKFPQEEQRC